MAKKNLYGTELDSSVGQGAKSPYVIGRVKKIVYGPYLGSGRVKLRDPDYTGPSDIGKIKFEILYSTLTTSVSGMVSEPAYPVFDFIKQLPLLNEIVFIIPGPTEKLNDRMSKQQFFYFPPYSTWNKVNHGAFPNQQENVEITNQNANRPGYEGSAAPEDQQIILGNTFQENDKIRNLRPFEGDTLLQGRFGQSIRFGSTIEKDISSKLYGSGIKNPWSNSGKNGDPITIIQNRQGDRTDPLYVDMTENINIDGSSIYMTSTQEIFLQDLINFPLKSFGTGIDVVVQPTVEVRTLPTTNEIQSANEQDKLSMPKISTPNS